MTLREEIMQNINEVPENSLTLLLQFVRFLKEEAKMEKLEKKTIRHGGWVKGEIWMSDDFDDPLEFVSADEMRVLEAMRENKRAELQEAVV